MAQSNAISPGTIIAGAAVLVGGIFVLKPLITSAQNKSELNKDQASTIKPKPGKVLKNLNGKPVSSVNLSTIAVDLYNALHPGWYKPTDQARAVIAFKSTPYGYVKQLENIYLDKYGENLKKVMGDKLSFENFTKVKYWFE